MHRQMRHQIKVERQQCVLHLFKQGEDIATALGIDKEIGILDAFCNALQRLQCAKIKPLQPEAQLLGSNRGKNRHVRKRGRQRLSTPARGSESFDNPHRHTEAVIQ